MMLNNTNNFHHQFSFFNFDLNNNSDNNSNNKINNFIKFNKHNNYNGNDNNIHYYHHHCNNNVKNKLLQSPTLPSDVLLEIFKYIEDDKHSLYDCLLVNKNWFQLVVPLLWKRPFVLLKKSNKEEDNSNSNNNYYFDEYLNITCNNNVDIENTENINRSSLIDTYIACSSDDFKSQLFDKFGICLSGQLKNPILNYSTYLRDLDLAELESSIICWLSLSDYCYNVYDVYWELFSFITSEICKMLFVNSNGLWSFSLGSWDEETSTIPNLSSLSSPLMVFRNLKTLEIKGDFDYLKENDTANLTKILELLINNSTKNVEYINIDITGNHENSQTEKLRKLIESQRSLNYFRYSRTNCSEAFSEEYINSCSTQSKSLKKLVFDSVPLSEDSILPLIKCNNLDLLQFNSCYQKNKIKEENVNVNENDNDEIISCHLENNTNNLMKINKLKFLSSHLDSVVTTILYLVNCNLSELTLENPTKAHLEVINRHCTNLNYLALSTTTNTLISSSILLSTTNLKHLVLYLRNYSIKMTEQDLNQLGKNLPISLNTLHLNSIFGYDELEYLLKDFHPNIKSLIITIDHVGNSSSSSSTLVDERLLGEGEIRRKSHNDNNNQNYYDNYLKVVMNYAKTKHLSEFSYNITKLKNQPSNLLLPEMIFSKGLLNEAKQFIQNISTKSIFPFECDDYEVLCD